MRTIVKLILSIVLITIPFGHTMPTLGSTYPVITILHENYIQPKVIRPYQEEITFRATITNVNGGFKPFLFFDRSFIGEMKRDGNTDTYFLNYEITQNDKGKPHDFMVEIRANDLTAGYNQKKLFIPKNNNQSIFKTTNYKIIGEADPRYNCLSYGMDVTDYWLWDNNSIDTVDEMMSYLEDLYNLKRINSKYELVDSIITADVILYGVKRDTSEIALKHVAKKITNDTAISKFGENEIFEHPIYNAFTEYGEPVAFLKKSISYNDSINGPRHFVYGDVDGNHEVNNKDSVLINDYLLRRIKEFPSLNGLQAADVNGDMKVNSADFLLINQYNKGYIKTFPVEQTPRLLYASILNGQKNVSPETNFLTFTYSTPVELGSVSISDDKGAQIKGFTVLPNCDNNRIDIYLNHTLKPGKTYKVVLNRPRNIKTKEKYTGYPYELNFTTSKYSNLPTSISISQNAKNVPLSTRFITFKYPDDVFSDINSFCLYEENEEVGCRIVHSNPNEIVFDVKGVLKPGKAYMLKVSVYGLDRVKGPEYSLAFMAAKK